ncbi:NCA2 family protein [Aspergillus clavatus NRRL 1]|uniref:ATP synthase regulation protein NCA2 n=1 Tax=Aspergillus clavatus (strain ATCC 1007 / CBS 513.65 / DSM 816 / NCTC 3887 / NRRL 1 / QM 1276 / 107) TaxID=344612 RepID=A1C5V0_ASPCL|nr:uncharacterized protein ACLA_067980 [Aspergillus clavatus NRRL 1]EAW13771.1 conserved hypothetical protein [Aspergillus clavatus NRRL 1]
MNVFHDNVQDISEEVLYWDDVLGSNWYTGLYALQTSPDRIWSCINCCLLHREKQRTQRGWGVIPQVSWVQFYNVVHRCLKPTKMRPLHNLILSPFVSCRSEIRQKRKALMAMKLESASSLGLIMEQCLSFETEGVHGEYAVNDHLRDTICRSVTMLESLLKRMPQISGSTHLEAGYLNIIDHDIARLPSDLGISEQNPGLVIKQLSRILGALLPSHMEKSRKAIKAHGRPSYLVRCWLPLLVALLSGSTFLKILTSRWHEILRWITDIGSTTFEFWSNWVVEPLRKLIGTIRHDERSEIALMSKNSLEADRASLERMVLDFVLDRGELGHEQLAAQQIQSITAKIREGDLTPVLRAYENDLRKPFVGTIRGDLIRALLIQIQKTKVDVEIAIGGIDSLLKSQELVFGFVGLTPGIMVTYAFLRWLLGLFGNRKGLQIGRRQHEMRHALRNVDRTLTLSTPTDSGTLTFKDYGLLLCDAEALLRTAVTVLKGVDLREFHEDINDLLDIRNGVSRQLQVVNRISWTYSRWIR